MGSRKRNYTSTIVNYVAGEVRPHDGVSGDEQTHMQKAARQGKGAQLATRLAERSTYVCISMADEDGAFGSAERRR
jgi:hypothetical protein